MSESHLLAPLSPCIISPPKPSRSFANLRLKYHPRAQSRRNWSVGTTPSGHNHHTSADETRTTAASEPLLTSQPLYKHHLDDLLADADESLICPRPSIFDPNTAGLSTEGESLLQSEEIGWCSLCGTRSGWMECGTCDGKGGYPTKPGLAGVSGKVGWARCKSCYGRKRVPCFMCGMGMPNLERWLNWQKKAKRWPVKTADHAN